MDTVAESTMSRSLPVFGADCPSRTVLDVVANKWVLYVLGMLRLADRPMRFGELLRSVEGVTQKSLTKTLRALERDGFVQRRVYASVPMRVEYSLTDLGRDIGPLLAVLHDWAKKKGGLVVQARTEYDAATQG